MWIIHIGTFLLVAAFVLLLVASVACPVVNGITLLNLYTPNAMYRFGVWGFCRTTEITVCTRSRLGYDLTGISALIAGRPMSISLTRLTRSFVLHPIACGLTFVAIILSVLSNVIGYLIPAVMTFLVFCVSFIVMVIDFAVMGNVKLRAQNVEGVTARFGTAVWLTLAATICLLFAFFFTLFAICFGDPRDDGMENDVGRDSNDTTHSKRGLLNLHNTNESRADSEMPTQADTALDSHVQSEGAAQVPDSGAPVTEGAHNTETPQGPDAQSPVAAHEKPGFFGRRKGNSRSKATNGSAPTAPDEGMEPVQKKTSFWRH